jgi:hypothetical protein
MRRVPAFVRTMCAAVGNYWPRALSLLRIALVNAQSAILRKGLQEATRAWQRFTAQRRSEEAAKTGNVVLLPRKGAAISKSTHAAGDPSFGNQQQAPAHSKQAWRWYPIQPSPEEGIQMGDLLFLPGGTVVIGNAAHADSEPINQDFGSWTARRKAGFKNVLVIEDSFGDTARFTYQQHRWWKGIAYEIAPNESLGHAIKRELVHRGVMGTVAYSFEWTFTTLFGLFMMVCYYGFIAMIIFCVLGWFLGLLLSLFVS